MSYQRARESRYSIAPDDELGLTPDDIDALSLEFLGPGGNGHGD